MQTILTCNNEDTPAQQTYQANAAQTGDTELLASLLQAQLAEHNNTHLRAKRTVRLVTLGLSLLFAAKVLIDASLKHSLDWVSLTWLLVVSTAGATAGLSPKHRESIMASLAVNDGRLTSQLIAVLPDCDKQLQAQIENVLLGTLQAERSVGISSVSAEDLETLLQAAVTTENHTFANCVIEAAGKAGNTNTLYALKRAAKSLRHQPLSRRIRIVPIYCAYAQIRFRISTARINQQLASSQSDL